MAGKEWKGGCIYMETKESTSCVVNEEEQVQKEECFESKLDFEAFSLTCGTSMTNSTI